MARRLLRLNEVKQRTGLSKSSIYNQIADATFPEPVPIGARAVAWVEDEIQEWINNRIAERRKAAWLIPLRVAVRSRSMSGFAVFRQ